MEDKLKNIDFPEFKNDFHLVRLNIFLTESYLMESVRKFFDEFDITAQQYNIMRIVEVSEVPLSILQIRERMLEKMCDASRLIDRLILKNLVIKKVSNVDKRLVEVYLTPKGLELLTEIKGKVGALEKPIKDNISEEEAATLCTLLSKMRGTEPNVFC
ncbi:MarR family transcriptional regulator [Arachidicoccus ginsenosidivorans]|uniref:MarR family transcriptional regulator n=1 Tax=Arachidicoccus ginsenosidivorans TaxID=496057 RepID=A0A5B8VMN6_9BACT|nr:MarR family transcriptional regulator [Arachidicoccus ginsenosidivorans]QEC72740.1 MarR family transcriptional regulator [Arachidicoccus ginsenosidivorans]